MNKLKKILKIFLPEKLIALFWHKPKAILAVCLYGFPSRKITVIGVAGTKGKTTTCHLISQILEFNNKKTAMISTVAIKIGLEEKLNNLKMTSPNCFFLQRFIKRAVRAKCQYLILEVSSHALSQYRVFGISFQTIILTGLLPDHLDYHKDAQAYKNIHKKLFGRKLKTIIFNGDDRGLLEFLKTLSKNIKNKETIFYGFKNQSFIKQQKNYIFAYNIFLKQKNSFFSIKTIKGETQINLPFLGNFNISNSLGAIALGISKNIDLETIKKALKQSKVVPGRLEYINEGQNFKVMVDYAHSSDSLKALYQTILPFAQGKIITLFGACGDRDKNQRPIMGEIISQYSDYVIVTNDDPYTENPEKIAQQLLSGVLKQESKDIIGKRMGYNVWKILDREKAIERAISSAQENDLVLILGKGAEQWQVFKNKKIPWDDRKVVRKIIAVQFGSKTGLS